MSNTICLSCGAKIPMDSVHCCPFCNTRLPHNIINFLMYLGPEDSLNGYQRSYKLVLLKLILGQAFPGGRVPVISIVKSFKDYYVCRKKNMLIPDQDCDSRIMDAEKSSLHDIETLIQMNPFAAISRKGFLQIRNISNQKFYVLCEGFETLNSVAIYHLQQFLSIKLNLYYEKIHSTAMLDFFTDYDKKPISLIQSASLMENNSSNNTPREVNDHRSSQRIDCSGLSTDSLQILQKHNITTITQMKRVYETGEIVQFAGITRAVYDEIGRYLNIPGNFGSMKAKWLNDFTHSLKGKSFNLDLPSNLKNAPISSIFSEGNFHIFTTYCEKNKLVTLDDLIGMPYATLIAIPGLGVTKIKAIIKRWTDTMQMSSIPSMPQKYIPTNAINNARWEFLNSTIEIDPSNFDFPITVLRFFQGTRKIQSILQAAEMQSLSELNSLSLNTLSKRAPELNVEKFYESIKIFRKPYKDVFQVIFNDITTDKSFEIYSKRASGNTLQAVADEYGITRERVRQVSIKFDSKIISLLTPLINNLLQQNDARYFTADQVLAALENPDYSPIILFAIENHDSFTPICSASIFLERTAFPNAEKELSTLVYNIVGDGINIFESTDKIQAAFEEHGYPFLTSDNFLDLLIQDDYVFYGDIAVNSSKSYAFLCSKIVEESFPDGISNSVQDLDRLRSLSTEKYGKLDIPQNNRSFFSRVSSYLVLRGRSTYIAPSHIEADRAVIEDIKNYIDQTNKREIYYAEIFAEFEGVLTFTTNIDNSQFLHGVLMFYYPDEYIYSRDYLTKEVGLDKGNIGIQIKDYISSVGRAVHKKDILQQFPGISDTILLNASMNTSGLISWQPNYYNSVENIKITEADKHRIEEAILELQEANNGYCSEGMLYQTLKPKFKEFFELNSIRIPQNLFYISQEFFSSDFIFKRPHITVPGAFDSISVVEIALKLLNNTAEIHLSEFNRLYHRLKWADETSYLAFNEIISTKNYLQVDEDTYVQENSLGLSQNDIDYVRQLISKTAGEAWFLPLQNFSNSEENLPCGYSVNEFSIFSIASKFSIGWHIVNTLVKNRKYMRGILVQDSVKIYAYDKLIAEFLRRQSIFRITSSELLTLLQLHGLVSKTLPRELQNSPSFNYHDDIYDVI